MLREELELRKLPSLLTMNDGSSVESPEQWEERRTQIQDLLEHMYAGVMPPLRTKVEGVVTATDEHAFADKAIHQQISIHVKTAGGPLQFAAHLALPKQVAQPPMFLYISLQPGLVNELCPVEEILDNGYGIASFYYQDIVPDNKSPYLCGAAGLYSIDPYESWGSISMWAWGAKCLMDYLQTRDDVDRQRVAVVGHSRLGKTALWAGATDPRFSMVISNESGGGGAALFRGKTGEQISNFRSGASRKWFCGNFIQFADKVDEMPFDMHFLLALTAPRHLYVCSAEGDVWADPTSEFLSAVAASAAYEACGLEGLVTPDQLPEAPAVFHQGHIGYHVRKGTHFLCRQDWQNFMKYRELHGC